jgi:hypothetical protein
MIKFFAYFRHDNTLEFETIELQFSCLHKLSGNERWFCRIWRKDWIELLPKREFGESYGKTKFEAYRKAIINLNESDSTQFASYQRAAR